MRRERERHAFVSGKKFFVVEVLELERLCQDDRVLRDAIRPVYEIAGIELEQAAIEIGTASVVWECS